MKDFADRVAAFLLYLFSAAVSLLPFGLHEAAGESIGLLLYYLIPKRRRVAESNIASCVDYINSKTAPENEIRSNSKFVREVFINIGRVVAECFLVLHKRSDSLLKNIQIRGIENFESAHAKGKGVIILTGHCGNWELAVLGFSSILKMPVSVVANRQKNPYINKMVEKMREQFGNRIIYKKGALKGMLGVLRRNGLVGLIVDQAVFPDQGSVVNFLGRPAWASNSPVMMAKRTGAAVIPSFVHREGKRHIITFYPELKFKEGESEESVRDNIQLYTDRIENYIISHPTEWFWVHKRWKRTEGLA